MKVFAIAGPKGGCGKSLFVRLWLCVPRPRDWRHDAPLNSAAVICSSGKPLSDLIISSNVYVHCRRRLCKSTVCADIRRLWTVDVYVHKTKCGQSTSRLLDVRIRGNHHESL